ncbi:MAG: DUF3431 domain-containing protein, partial [Nitrospiraceae bacterium]|nr:DUF3431 domain-containing protein [Nitrospiraceae bacterium]
MPNCGRESHSYLTHIVENYQNLADLSVFAQGHPFDHCADFHTILRDLERRKMPPETFHWLGFILDWDDPKGHRLFRAWSKNPEQEELDLSGFFQKLFHQDCPPRLTFFPGAQFIVHRDLIHRRSLEFYRQALELSLHFPQAAHCFERCWDRVFQVNGIWTTVGLSERRRTQFQNIEISGDLETDMAWFEGFGGYRFIETPLSKEPIQRA